MQNAVASYNNCTESNKHFNMHHISLSSNVYDIFKRYLVRVRAREPAILPEVSVVFSFAPGECYSTTFKYLMITVSLLFTLHHTPPLFRLIQLMQ